MIDHRDGDAATTGAPVVLAANQDPERFVLVKIRSHVHRCTVSPDLSAGVPNLRGGTLTSMVAAIRSSATGRLGVIDDRGDIVL